MARIDRYDIMNISSAVLIVGSLSYVIYQYQVMQNLVEFTLFLLG